MTQGTDDKRTLIGLILEKENILSSAQVHAVVRDRRRRCRLNTTAEVDLNVVALER